MYCYFYCYRVFIFWFYVAKSGGTDSTDRATKTAPSQEWSKPLLQLTIYLLTTAHGILIYFLPYVGRYIDISIWQFVAVIPFRTCETHFRCRDSADRCTATDEQNILEKNTHNCQHKNVKTLIWLWCSEVWGRGLLRMPPRHQEINHRKLRQ